MPKSEGYSESGYGRAMAGISGCKVKKLWSYRSVLSDLEKDIHIGSPQGSCDHNLMTKIGVYIVFRRYTL
jgi:hypothetical protein